ncbi:hypothetical protein BDZ89DRAFT_1037645 [Hymenopellis radicata]|nr:hypothetical protein BDZ89DRAFT_1037645 [Hymenopellis radicata]
MSSFMSNIMLLCSLFGLFLVAHASPLTFPVDPARRLRATSLGSRTTAPYFPDTPASCPICSANYANIQNCAEAAPVLANFSMVCALLVAIIFNPGAFVNVIQCSCTETFQAVFPQCVECFQATNQTDVLSTNDLPSVVAGMKQICALESTLLGNVASANGEIPTTTSAAPAATSSSAALSQAPNIYVGTFIVTLFGLGTMAGL